MGIIEKKLRKISKSDINANGNISENQIECAINVLSSFDSEYPKSNFVVVKGEPQSGKTGVLYAIQNIINKYNLKYALDIKRTLYITGDNSKDLITQQKDRRNNDFMSFSDEDVDIVFLKRSDFKKYMENEDSIDNTIIFIDESHYGTTKKSNLLPQFLKHYGINYLKNSNLEEHNIRIISNSATPYCELISDKVESKKNVYLKPSKGYVGIEDFCNSECFIPLKRNVFSKRCAKEEKHIVISDTYNHLKKIEKETGKVKCAIFRIHSKNDLENLKKYAGDFFDFEEFDTNKMKSLNYEALWNKIDTYCEIKRHRTPNKYLMVIVKDALRMGISIREREDNNGTKNNIAVLYDIPSNREKIEVTEQGLLGRMCGYRSENDYEWKDTRFYLNESHCNIMNKTVDREKIKDGRLITPVKSERKTKNILLEDINGLVSAYDAGKDIKKLEKEGKVYHIDVPDKNYFIYDYDATDFFLSKVGTKFGGFDIFQLEHLKTPNYEFVDNFIKPFLSRFGYCDIDKYVCKPGSRRSGEGVGMNEGNFISDLKNPNKKMLVNYPLRNDENGKYAWQALLNMEEMERENNPKIYISVKGAKMSPYKSVIVDEDKELKRTADTMITE